MAIKRNEIEEGVDLTLDANHIPNNLSPFKYKSSFITSRYGVKIAVSLKHLGNFWRSLEMPLTDCKVKLSLKWDKKCILSTEDGNLVFAITDTKLYVPIVTLSAEDHVKLSKLLGKGFKRPIYWSQYKVIPGKTYNAYGYIRELLYSSYQGVKRLLVLDNTNGITPNSRKIYFLPRIEIKNYNIEIDGRNFYDQPINDIIKQYDEVRKVSTAQGDDYTTGCLIDFAYFFKKLQINCSRFK